MGDCYRHGYGVERSNEMAVKFYDIAAQRGSALAHFHLGEMAEEGVGLSQVRHNELLQLRSREVQRRRAV